MADNNTEKGSEQKTVIPSSPFPIPCSTFAAQRSPFLVLRSAICAPRSCSWMFDKVPIDPQQAIIMILSLSGSKRKKMFTLLFVKDMTRKMWSCQLCTHNQCAVLCAFTVGYISVAIENVFCRLMPILMLFKSLFRGGKLQIPSLWNDTFFARATYYNLPLDVVRNCTDRRLLQNVAAIIVAMRITKCIILAKCRNCYYKILVSPLITL